MSARNTSFTCFLFFCFTICVFVLFLCLDTKPVHRYTLEKVVILSRHGLRTPLSKNLKKITPFEWPQWKEKPGYLTEKGFVLEGYMGSYFKSWLEKNRLLQEKCPQTSEFFVYSNNMERTMSSAEAFVSKAFPDCNITINHSSDKSDPIFSPYIHNKTNVFRKIATEEMLGQLKTLHLNSSYEIMENILNYTASDLCMLDKKCDMTSETNFINITAGNKPKMTGPLKLCNEVIDAFFMEYYSGFSLNNVAWGNLKNMDDWISLLSIPKDYHNVLYNTSIVAKDISKPLINYMSNLFISNYPKVTLLMGHDANINAVLSSMEFKPFELEDEFVSTPIGGKIVFQKWFDSKLEKFLLKIEYVYQTKDQLRENVSLSDDNPPQFLLLELNKCPVIEDGFCLWDDFIAILNQSIAQ